MVHFGDISGLVANLGKCSIYFGGVHHGKQKELANLLGFKIGNEPFKYLGVGLNISGSVQCTNGPGQVGKYEENGPRTLDDLVEDGG
ncbi:hypothetical protein Dimus_004370 [Dionaea muscipula]